MEKHIQRRKLGDFRKVSVPEAQRVYRLNLKDLEAL